MSKKQVPVHAGFANLLKDVKIRIQSAQVRAVTAVNAELLIHAPGT
jgi:hypothetical protein